MARRGKVWIPTTTFSRAYIERAWQSRGDLTDYERRGFAQFLYLTIVGQIESAIASLLLARLNSIGSFVRWDKLPMVKYAQGDKSLPLSREPIVNSIGGLVEYMEKQVQRAPLNLLQVLYGVLFESDLKAQLGDELYDDLQAVSDLRNLFAHGRNLYMEFEGAYPFAVGTIEKNPLENAAKRLVRARILKSIKFTSHDYHDLQAKFYSDEALLYFYNSAMAIEDRLEASMSFEPEKHMAHHQKLKALPSL